jgi:hypothetical protein
MSLSLAAVVSDQNEVLFTDICTEIEKNHSWKQKPGDMEEENEE